jgi:hypothetical protein
MLSVNYISNFLSEKQTKIDPSFYYRINNFEKKIDKFQCNLKESFEVLFNKSIVDFYYDNNFYKNKSTIFTLINSIFTISDELFKLKNEDEREIIIKEFLKKIDKELFEKDLYNKFGYNKNRKFNKADIQIVLKNSLLFNSCEKLYLLIDYIVHYLGINLYIIQIENNLINFTKCSYYLTKYFDGINKNVPHFILILENEIYKPILLNNKNENFGSSIITNSKYSELIENIWKYLNINEEIEIEIEKNKNINISKTEEISGKKYNLSILKDLKLDNLKNLCIENNIDLTKKSDKTSKMINKIKIDLINDLLKI